MRTLPPYPPMMGNQTMAVTADFRQVRSTLPGLPPTGWAPWVAASNPDTPAPHPLPRSAAPEGSAVGAGVPDLAFAGANGRPVSGGPRTGNSLARAVPPAAVVQTAVDEKMARAAPGSGGSLKQGSPPTAPGVATQGQCLGGFGVNVGLRVAPQGSGDPGCVPIVGCLQLTKSTSLSSHSCFFPFALPSTFCPKDPEPHPTGPTLAPAASRFITSRLEVDAAPARGIGDALARVPGRQLGEVDKSLRTQASAVVPRVPPLTTLARLVTPIPTDTGSRCGSGSESGAGACASASTPEGPGPSCSGVVPWPGVNPTAAATAAQDRHAVNDARAGAVPHGRGLKFPRGATATVQLEGTNAAVNLKSMLIDTRFSPAPGSDGEQHASASDMLSSSLQPALPTSGCT